MQSSFEKFKEIQENGRYSIHELLNLREQIRKEDSPNKEEELEYVDNFLRNLGPSKYKDEIQKVLNRRRVANVVRELIGERSIRRTAEDTGVAASYITGILKEKYLPSADILRKLASPESRPQNGVMLEDLMIAAGYQNNYVDEGSINVMLDDIQEQANVESKSIEPNIEIGLIYEAVRNSIEQKDREEEEEKRMQRRREFHNMREKFCKLSKGLILQGLLEKGIMVKSSEIDNIARNGVKADLKVELNNQPIDEWWFEFKYLDCSDRRMGHSFLDARHILGRYIFIEPNHRRKITIVINSENDFEIWKAFAGKLAYRGELSAVLIDMENFSIVDEVYLSHYEQEDNGKELKLI